jgi:hypothetical protein
MVPVRLLLIVLFLAWGAAATAAADVLQSPLLLRAESLAVLPRSKPVIYVHACNVTTSPVTATISVAVPAGWQLTRSKQAIELAGGEQQRIGFPVADGREHKDNSYPITIKAECDGRVWSRQQVISVASAPYFKPQIDGTFDDWEAAIPVSFKTGERKTVIASYWNRRHLSLLISVDEKAYVPRGAERYWDAVQISLAPRDSISSRDPEHAAERFEFLVFADQAGRGHCCQLATPETSLSATTIARKVEQLAEEKAEVVVKRIEGTTYYELALPLAKLRKFIRPSEGREFYLSVLVHDPDGVGIRDWGVAAGFWPQQRNRLAWSDWEGAQWGTEPPMDCRAAWGMCSSRY